MEDYFIWTNLLLVQRQHTCAIFCRFSSNNPVRYEATEILVSCVRKTTKCERPRGWSPRASYGVCTGNALGACIQRSRGFYRVEHVRGRLRSSNTHSRRGLFTPHAGLCLNFVRPRGQISIDHRSLFARGRSLACIAVDESPALELVEGRRRRSVPGTQFQPDESDTIVLHGGRDPATNVSIEP